MADELNYLVASYTRVAALSDRELTRCALSDMAFAMNEHAEAARRGYNRRRHTPRHAEATLFEGLHARLQQLAAEFPGDDEGVGAQ